MRPPALFCALVALSGNLVSAECETRAVSLKSPMPMETIELRRRLFYELCKKSEGALVDAQDFRNDGHVKLPEFELPNVDYYPEVLKRRWVQGTVIVVYVLEVDKTVSWIGVLKSSGTPLMDSAAVEYIKALKRSTPLLLEGVPVRAFFSEQIKFELAP